MHIVRILSLALMLALFPASFAPPFPTQAQAQGLIKIAAFAPVQSVAVGDVIKPWMESINKETNAVRLHGFWGGTLGRSPFKQFDLVKNGIADIGWVMPSYTAGQFPEMGLFELPFLFRNAEEASIVGWQLYEQGLLTGFDGVHLIGFFTTEPNGLFMGGGIADLSGLKHKKIRAVGGIHAAWLASLGAASESISSAEMNEALSRSTLDGAVQGWTGMKTFRSLALVEQAHNIPVGVIPFLLLMNQAKWDSLPAAAKQKIASHSGLAIAKMGGRAYTDAANAVYEEVVAEGRIAIIEYDDEARALWAEQARATHQAWIEATPNGQAVYDAAVAILTALRE